MAVCVPMPLPTQTAAPLRLSSPGRSASSSWRVWLPLLLIGCWFGLSSPALADQDHAPAPAGSVVNDDEFVPGAKRLEGRLLAPCCWDSSKQTLDVHDSPVAHELKREIRRRLKAGETPDAIEADLVGRYGEKLRAVPEGNPLKRLALLLALLVGGAGVGLGYMLVRWKRRTGDNLPTPDPDAKRDKWDDELDAELARDD